MKANTTHVNSDSFVSSLRDGDAIAFETLFRLYYDKLLHIAIGYIENHQDAEGVVQNIFLKIWEHRSKLKKGMNLSGYMYTMTKNACLDHLKHKTVKKNYLGHRYYEIKKLQNAFIKDEAASLLLQNELEQKITESLDLLPEKCKKVFIKSRIEGLKNKEIADVMGLSKRTVDNHISNALKHLRVHLRDFLTFFL